jgi:PAS domain S-box-containing protein
MPVDGLEPVAAGVFPLEQYRTLVENSPLLMWRSGPGGQRDYFNETWLRFTGRSLAQELADGWLEGVHPDDSPRCVETMLDHVRKREPFEREFRLRRHDGLYRFVSERGMPFYNEAEFGGFLGACWDVQQRREAESAQESALRMMAHELRTPLQSLSMFIELMRRNSERGQPSPSEIFSKARSQLDRLSRLFTDLLEASRVAELPLSLEPLDLEGLVKTVVETRSRALKAQGSARHAITLTREKRPFPVEADRLRLEQAFGNLLDNALKYSPRGGAIDVAMRSQNGWHSVSVCDAGIGIPPEDVQSVGQRFFRAGNASSNNFPGLGVGFALARESVERMRGAVRIESTLGRGTCVTMTLPAWETEGP